MTQAEAQVDYLSKLLADTEQSRDLLSVDLQAATKALKRAEKPNKPTQDSAEIYEAESELQQRCKTLESMYIPS